MFLRHSVEATRNQAKPRLIKGKASVHSALFAKLIHADAAMQSKDMQTIRSNFTTLTKFQSSVIYYGA